MIMFCAYRVNSAVRQIGVCRDATVGAAISRPLLFRQRKCFRLLETLRNLNVFGRLIAAPTVAFAILQAAISPEAAKAHKHETENRAAIPRDGSAAFIS